MVGPEDFGTGWRGTCSFMINRPTLSCSHWLEFVYTECFHDVIMSGRHCIRAFLCIHV